MTQYTAVDYGSFMNMRAMERGDTLQTGVLRPGNPDDPESYKTRRGIVGGFRDYLSQDQIHDINNLIIDSLVKAWWPAAFAADRAAGPGR
jgi:hypothetical protein